MATEVGKPVQIRLREDQIERLARLGEQRGVSVDDLVQEGVDTLLAGVIAPPTDEQATEVEYDPDNDPFRELIGMIDSGVGDLAVNHDKYLVEMLEEERRRWQAKSS